MARLMQRAETAVQTRQRVSWGAMRLMIRQLLENPLDKDRILLRCEQVRP